MIEAKMLVGRFLQFNPTPKRGLTGNPPAIVPVLCPALTIQESHRKDPGAAYNPFRNVGGVRESNVVVGTNVNANKVHRNFKWLPWYEGDISTTDFTCDVLTGPMSGCILVSYTSATGAPMVGHVGTVSVSETIPASVNTNVKNLWNQFAQNLPLANQVRGFNPVDAAIPGHGPAQGGDAKGETWGLFAHGGGFFAINVWIQKGTIDTFRIAGVHPATPIAPPAVLNL